MDAVYLISFLSGSALIYLPPTSPHSSRLVNPSLVDNLLISPTQLSSVVSDLKNSTHDGPDDIPSHFLKKCYASLEKPLLIIFNSSLSSGVFPVQWKNGFIHPI